MATSTPPLPLRRAPGLPHCRPVLLRFPMPELPGHGVQARGRARRDAAHRREHHGAPPGVSRRRSASRARGCRCVTTTCSTSRCCSAWATTWPGRPRSASSQLASPAMPWWAWVLVDVVLVLAALGVLARVLWVFRRPRQGLRRDAVAHPRATATGGAPQPLVGFGVSGPTPRQGVSDMAAISRAPSFGVAVDLGRRCVRAARRQRDQVRQRTAQRRGRQVVSGRA